MSDELLDYAGVAAVTGLSAATLRGYRAAGRMPDPDASPAPDRPRWRRATITSWLAERPGRGAPGRTRKTQPRCPDCRQTFPTERDVDDHVLAARHWDDDVPARRARS